MDERFGGDDAGRGHVQRGVALDVRLALANFGGVNQAQAFDSVVLAAFLECEKFCFLLCVGGHNEFSAVAERNVVLNAKFVRQPVAFDRVAGLQRILRIINSRMNDAAVARAGRHAELGKLLDEKTVLPGLGNGAGDSAADDATADDYEIGLFHCLKSRFLSALRSVRTDSEKQIIDLLRLRRRRWRIRLIWLRCRRERRTWR